MLPFRPHCQPTSLSPLPHDDATEAWDAVTRHMPGLPALPLLVNAGETPALITASGFAGAEINGHDIVIDRARALHELDGLYAHYLRGTTAPYGLELAVLPQVVQPEHAAIRRARAVCATVLGPVSLALTMVDEQATPVIDNAELLDALGKHVYLRQRWLRKSLERSGRPVLVWIYEPYLTVVQSAFSPALSEHLLSALDQALGSDGVRALWVGDAAAALALPPFLRVDLLGMPLPSIDQAAASGAAITRWLADHTALGWGIVPATTEGLANTTAGKLAARFEAWLRDLTQAGVASADLLAASLILPEDSLAYLTAAEAEQALARTAELSSLIRQSYGVD